MKKIYQTLFVFTVICKLSITNLYAQVPQALNYQAIARNASGNEISNQVVSLRYTIRDSSALGTVLYQETSSATTNQFGLFTSSVGAGTPTGGTFSGINWGSGSKFLQVEIDVTGGSTYILMGATQLLSVPYALHAQTSGDNNWQKSGNNISNTNTGNVGIGTTSPAASAALEINSTTGAVLLPRMTAAERDALTPVAGMIIFNTDEQRFEGYSNIRGHTPVSNPEFLDTTGNQNFGTCGPHAQTFVAVNNAPLVKMRFFSGGGGVVNPIRYILRTGSTVGSGTVLGQTDVNVPTTLGWFDVVFAGNPMLIAGQPYHVEINSDRGTSTCTYAYISNGSIYSGGAFYFYNDLSSQWDIFATSDTYFAVVQEVNDNTPGWVDLH